MSVAGQRCHAVLEVLSAGAPVDEGRRPKQISPTTVAAWTGRYRTDSLAGVADLSHRPHRDGWGLAAQMEKPR